MESKKFAIIGFAAILTLALVFVMRAHRPQIHTACNDVRPERDGGFFATIESSGFSSKSSLKLFTKVSGRPQQVGIFDIINQNGHTFRARQISLSLQKGDRRYSGFLKGRVGNHDISATMTCTRI
ncbi:MAG: hypothetical protein IT289_12215 [Oligoflexia bacterium]|nr:hypothetical protein [Oligoflexia bacterium]